MSKPEYGPWLSAPEDLKISRRAGPKIALIVANLTPDRSKIRIGVMINGKESTVVLPFATAREFVQDVQTLIVEKGEDEHAT